MSPPPACLADVHCASLHQAREPLMPTDLSSQPFHQAEFSYPVAPQPAPTPFLGMLSASYLLDLHAGGRGRGYAMPLTLHPSLFTMQTF